MLTFYPSLPTPEGVKEEGVKEVMKAHAAACQTALMVKAELEGRDLLTVKE